MRAFKKASAGVSLAVASAVAAGSTLGLQQQLLADSGQPGATVLAVGFTNTGRAQGVSLAPGNVVTVYASGDDFNAGNVLYREFMSFGEPICFTGLANGAIITSTGGFYGASEISFGGTLVATMPLLSLGLGFTDSFMFSFRNSNRSTDNNAFVFVVNGPLASTVSVTYGDGSVITDQPPIDLGPWEFGYFRLDGDSEYQLSSTNVAMWCTAAGFDNSDPFSTNSPIGLGTRDARILLPLSNDVITHPRSGQMSAPFDGTAVNWYSAAGTEGSFTVSPGSPVNIQTATGVSTTDYRPSGFSRFLFTGSGVGNSGADGAGGDATPAMPVSAMSQVVAQPFTIVDAGNGDQASLTVTGPAVGTARYLEWDDATQTAVERYVLPLNRMSTADPISARGDQFHPVAGQISNEPDEGVVTLVGQLNPGVFVSNVPIGVIAQSNGTPTHSVRSQNGTTANTIINDDDETVMFGITPEADKAELRNDAAGILRRRNVDSAGAQTWEVA